MDADCGKMLHYHPFANQFLEKDKSLAISLNIERRLTDIIDTILDYIHVENKIFIKIPFGLNFQVLQ